jgi:hypothetical protein
MNEFERAMRDLRRAERRRAEQLEVKRLLEFYENANPLKYEAEIVWLHPPEIWPHVREAYSWECSRVRPIAWRGFSDGRVLVGYATHNAESSREIPRRFFYVMPFDMDRPNNNYPPLEGVDPLSVAPTVRGRRTARCYQLPTPEQRAAFEAILAVPQAKRDAQRPAAAERQRRHRAPEQKRRAHNARRRARRKENLSA